MARYNAAYEIHVHGEVPLQDDVGPRRLGGGLLHVREFHTRRCNVP